MKTVIDRVMATYGMLKRLTPTQERELRKVVTRFVRECNTQNETRMTVEALRYLRQLEDSPEQKDPVRQVK
jgi:uncharacterized protein (DUF2236 family)